MKPSGIFKQYIWIINTIYRSKSITFQELNERWIQTDMSGGIPMNRITFNRLGYPSKKCSIFPLNVNAREVISITSKTKKF